MGNDSKSGHHNQGQKDASRGEYHPPHGVLDDILAGSERMEENARENASYNKGHAATRGQTDGSKNTYSPPPRGMGKEAYDKAWESGYKNRK